MNTNIVTYLMVSWNISCWWIASRMNNLSSGDLSSPASTLLSNMFSSSSSSPSLTSSYTYWDTWKNYYEKFLELLMRPYFFFFSTGQPLVKFLGQKQQLFVSYLYDVSLWQTLMYKDVLDWTWVCRLDMQLKHCQRHYGPRHWLLWLVILVW